MRISYPSQGIARIKLGAKAFSAWTNSFLISLLIGVMALLSAFALVYVKDANRRLFIEKQTLSVQKQKIMTHWNQLLLEQSTWAAQARIQHVAKHRLKMVMPAPSDIVMIDVRR